MWFFYLRNASCQSNGRNSTQSFSFKKVGRLFSQRFNSSQSYSIITKIWNTSNWNWNPRCINVWWPYGKNLGYGNYKSSYFWNSNGNWRRPCWSSSIDRCLSFRCGYFYASTSPRRLKIISLVCEVRCEPWKFIWLSRRKQLFLVARSMQ